MSSYNSVNEQTATQTFGDAEVTIRRASAEEESSSQSFDWLETTISSGKSLSIGFESFKYQFMEANTTRHTSAWITNLEGTL